MSVTGVAVTEKEGKLRQIDRLVGSSILHGSESLCKLLRYLAEHAIDQPGGVIKEYQIATEVFGRPPDFDPRVDSTVRVQTGRLRSKLAEYYAGAGADDHWIVEIPKGAYAITFHPRVQPAAEPAPAAESATPAVMPQTPDRRGWVLAVVVLSTLLVVFGAALVILLLSRPPAQPAAVASQQPPSGPLADFWQGFTDTQEEPWVVFSNAEFSGRPETGMHYFNASVDDPNQIMDHYTGFGEVLGIHELDRVFSSLHHALRVKRGRLLSLDDAKNNDLIFVGSPSENLSLREIPTTQDFVFRRVEDGPRKGDLSIRNLRQRPGEEKVYLSTPRLPITEDYAVVGLMPGLNPSRLVMVLAGLTTIGTQGAVEFVCRANTVQELLKRVNRTGSGQVAPFEAVLRVKVTHGVPVQTELVAFHPRLQ